MEELKGTPDQILSPRQISQRLGLSKTTIWRLQRAGKFPAPVRLSPGRVGWRESVIDGWLRDREGA